MNAKLLLVAILSAVVVTAQTPSMIPLDVIIPPDEQVKMGLAKLSPEEREALRSYLAKRISDVYRAGVAQGNNYSLPSSSTKKQIVVDISGVRWLKQNIDRGALLLLEDGSLWEVSPLDKLDCMLWLPLSNIRVIESSRGIPGYDYMIINTDDGEKVHAKYLGKR